MPNGDAVLVERLKKAGAIILGKTNMPEFGLVGITDNLIFGKTVNPWNLKKTPGGSSGGAAAAWLPACARWHMATMAVAP